jgi:hypothetical protein
MHAYVVCGYPLQYPWQFVLVGYCQVVETVSGCVTDEIHGHSGNACGKAAPITIRIEQKRQDEVTIFGNWD